MKGKKGIGPLGIAVVAIAFFIFALGFGLFSWILGKNALVLVGVLLIAVGAIGLLKGFSPQIGFSLIAGGAFFILLPMFIKGLSQVTLASILG